MPRLELTPAAGLALATLLWSGNFIVGRALRDAIDPVALNAWRWAIALVVLLPFTAPALRQQWPLLRRHLPWVAALGFTGLALPHACIYQALKTTPAVNALLLLNLTPLVVALAARFLFGQPMIGRQWAGLALASAGAAALVVGAHPQALDTLRFGAGDLWMLPAVAGAAAHMLLLRRTPAGLTQGPLLALSAAAALLWLAPAGLATGGPAWPTTPALFAAALYVGVFASALAFWLWNRGVAAIGPVRASGAMLLMPVYGAALSAALLGEGLEAHQLVAGAFVIGGLVLGGRPAAGPVPATAAAVRP